MRACLLAGVLAAALSVCAPARAHEDGGLGFPGAKRLTISLGDDGSATATVLVGNTTTAPVLPAFSLFLREPGGGYAELAGTAVDVARDTDAGLAVPGALALVLALALVAAAVATPAARRATPAH